MTAHDLVQDDLVYLIDDDASVRASLTCLIRSMGLYAVARGSAQEFLDLPEPGGAACLVLDVRMPGMSGLDLQRELARRGRHIPIIFITAHGDIPMCAQAIKAGGVEFLSKPFRHDVLVGAIRQALALDRALRAEEARVASLRNRYASLTVREREVAELVVEGLLNKQAASRLALSEITIKVHRRRVMEKMQAHSLAELVRNIQTLRAVEGRQLAVASGYPARYAS